MGDLSIFMASLGSNVLGIDFAEPSIAASRSRAAEQSSQAQFKVCDVFAVADLGVTFNTVVDCCFFHMFDDQSRMQYERVLQKIVNPSGRVYMLNFAIALPTPNAPRAITAADIEQTFTTGWSILELAASTIEVNFAPAGIPGTFACIEKCA